MQILFTIILLGGVALWMRARHKEVHAEIDFPNDPRQREPYWTQQLLIVIVSAIVGIAGIWAI